MIRLALLMALPSAAGLTGKLSRWVGSLIALTLVVMLELELVPCSMDSSNDIRMSFIAERILVVDFETSSIIFVWSMAGRLL